MLITLAVIGIVAAMTIPTLIQSHQEKVTVTKLKKFYSVISQAFEMAKMENGDLKDVDLTGVGSPAGSLALVDWIKPYLKVMKECRTTADICFAPGIYKRLNGSNLTQAAQMQED